MKGYIPLLGIALLSIVVCAEPEPTNPNFPRQREESNVKLQALLVGELVSENDCLRVMRGAMCQRLFRN